MHGGDQPDDPTGAVVAPIHLATTFTQPAAGEGRGFEYSRSGNPTRQALERCLASLEGAAHGFAFASGMAAEDAVLRLLPAGSHMILPGDAYGGTLRLVARVLGPAGLRHTLVDLDQPGRLDAAWEDDTRLVWLETPSNPMLTVVDIEAVSALAHGRGAVCVVDNTFATPFLQTPLALGADVVVHSTTKYLGGHSDVVGGFVAVDDDDLAARIGFVQNAAGAVPGPFDCYLVLRGLKTLALRMARHCDNAARVAELLVGHRAVARVLYPGLPGHPGHDVAARQMRSPGGMVSCLLTGGEAAALDLVARTRLFALAESLGAVESLISQPARMSHASAAGTPLEVDPALVRLSVGIETADDIVEDLRQALDSLGG